MVDDTREMPRLDTQVIEDDAHKQVRERLLKHKCQLFMERGRAIAVRGTQQLASVQFVDYPDNLSVIRALVDKLDTLARANVLKQLEDYDLVENLGRIEAVKGHRIVARVSLHYYPDKQAALEALAKKLNELEYRRCEACDSSTLENIQYIGRTFCSDCSRDLEPCLRELCYHVFTDHTQYPTTRELMAHLEKTYPSAIPIMRKLWGPKT